MSQPSARIPSSPFTPTTYQSSRYIHRHPCSPFPPQQPEPSPFPNHGALHDLLWQPEPEFYIASNPEHTPHPGKYLVEAESAPGHPEDCTSYHPGQAHWSEAYLERIGVLRQGGPPTDFRTVERSRKKQHIGVPDLRDAAGDPVNGVVYDDVSTIRDLPILPERISTSVEPWRIEAWRRLDPRIQWEDILIRMLHTNSATDKNTINVRIGRWRRNHHPKLDTWHGTRTVTCADGDKKGVPKKQRLGEMQVDTDRKKKRKRTGAKPKPVQEDDYTDDDDEDVLFDPYPDVYVDEPAAEPLAKRPRLSEMSCASGPSQRGSYMHPAERYGVAGSGPFYHRRSCAPPTALRPTGPGAYSPGAYSPSRSAAYPSQISPMQQRPSYADPMPPRLRALQSPYPLPGSSLRSVPWWMHPGARYPPPVNGPGTHPMAPHLPYPARRITAPASHPLQRAPGASLMPKARMRLPQDMLPRNFPSAIRPMDTLNSPFKPESGPSNSVKSEFNAEVQMEDRPVAATEEAQASKDEFDNWLVEESMLDIDPAELCKDFDFGAAPQNANDDGTVKVKDFCTDETMQVANSVDPSSSLPAAVQVSCAAGSVESTCAVETADTRSSQAEPPKFANSFNPASVKSSLSLGQGETIQQLNAADPLQVFELATDSAAAGSTTTAAATDPKRPSVSPASPSNESPHSLSNSISKFFGGFDGSSSPPPRKANFSKPQAAKVAQTVESSQGSQGSKRLQARSAASANADQSSLTDSSADADGESVSESERFVAQNGLTYYRSTCIYEQNSESDSLSELSELSETEELSEMDWTQEEEEEEDDDDDEDDNDDDDDDEVLTEGTNTQASTARKAPMAAQTPTVNAAGRRTVALKQPRSSPSEAQKQAQERDDESTESSELMVSSGSEWVPGGSQSKGKARKTSKTSKT